MALSVTYPWSYAPGLIDGTGSITAIGTSMDTDIPAVTVSKTLLDGGGYQFTDNRGHTLIGIETLDTSNFADVLDLEYSLADSCNWLSYILEVRCYGGDDIVTVGSTMPSDFDGTPRWGARVLGGSGNDKITGGSQKDTLYGDGELPSSPDYGNDTIWGGGGDDWIYGDGGNDALYGGTGNDTISGDRGLRAGRDKITGGKGADIIYDYVDGKVDIIYFNDLSDSTAKSFDRLYDFELATDTIDLGQIDANSHRGSNQAFKLVRQLSGIDGQLQAKFIDLTEGTRITLSGDVNGDKKVDFYFESTVADETVSLAMIHDCLLL